MKRSKFLLSLLIATVFSIIGGAVTAVAVGCSAVVPSVAYLVISMLPTPSGVLCINIFTAPGGAATAFLFQLNYLPEHLCFDNTVPLTSLKVETTDDGVLHDWTRDGLIAMADFLLKAPAVGTIQFRLADGELRPKNVTISGVTSGVGVVPFFISSDRVGRMALKSKNAYVLPNNPTTFEKFSALFIPTMASGTDRAEITFNNGLQQTFAMEDLLNLSGNYQSQRGVIINNTTAYINKVILTCAAATPVYILNANIPGQN